jgi:hypothetical protein
MSDIMAGSTRQGKTGKTGPAEAKALSQDFRGATHGTGVNTRTAGTSASAAPDAVVVVVSSTGGLLRPSTALSTGRRCRHPVLTHPPIHPIVFECGTIVDEAQPRVGQPVWQHRGGERQRWIGMRLNVGSAWKSTSPEIAAPGRNPRVRRIDVERVAVPLLLGLGLAIGVAVPIVLAVTTGSYSIPHNDDWSYSRIAEEFGRSGQIHLLRWNRSSLVGQFVVLGPAAASIEVQHLFVGLLGAAAIYACYELLKPFVGKVRAAFAAALVGIWPEFGLLSTSFMTDVPALAAVTIVLTLGARALARGSVWLLAAAVTVGVWGVTVREQALVAPAAVLVVAAWRARRGQRFQLWQVLAVGATFVVAVAWFEVWRRGLAGDDPPIGVSEDTPMLSGALDVAVRGYFVLALAVSPAVLALARPWRWTRAAWAGAGAVAGVAALQLHDVGPNAFLLTDYLTEQGPYPGVMDGDRHMLNPAVWQVVPMFAALSGILLAGGLVRWGVRLPPLLRVFLLFLIAGTLLTRAGGQLVFGRYLLLLQPALLCVVLTWAAEPPRRWRWYRPALASAAAAALAVLSIAVTAYGLAFDAARWDAGRRIVATGVAAADIDAGFEWSGYYSPHGVQIAPPRQPPINGYQAMFPNNRHCYLVSLAARADPAWQLVGTLTYRKYVVARRAKLWLYNTGLCDDHATSLTHPNVSRLPARTY